MIPETEHIIVNIKEHSSIPKFIQVANSIAADIESGIIKTGQRLPSINELSDKNSMSRDTAEKAYKVLRDRYLVFSVKGVGNFVSDINSDVKTDVFFLINKPSSYKMEVYNAFVDTIGLKGRVNMFIYYCDEELFINSLKKNINNYNYFIIMPHFIGKGKSHVNYTPKVIKAIEAIPKEKLVILDNSYSEISGNFTAIYQDYKKDIAQALEEGVEKVKKYKKFILVYPSKSLFPYPKAVLQGFVQFCKKHKMDFEVLDEIYPDQEFDSREAYITLEDSDLVNLIQEIRAKNLTMGVDVGVISYNETPLKALLGITVISTDFKVMGEQAAKLLLSGKKEIFKNPFHYIERNSL